MKIRFTDEVYDKLWAYTHSVNTEIAAWGYVTPTDGDLLVDDVFLVPQEVSGTSVDFVTEAMPYAVKKAMKDGRVNDLRFCWHSHVNMGVAYSGTDEEMIASIRDKSNVPWFVSTIFNKKGDVNGRLDIFESGFHEDLAPLYHVKGIELDVVTDSTELLDEQILDEIEKFVKVHKPRSIKPKGKTNVPHHKWIAPKSEDNDYNWLSDLDEYEWSPWDTDGPSAHDAIRVGGKLSGHDLTAMSDADLMKEVQLREVVLENMQSGWKCSPPDDGWVYVNDDKGNYRGQIITHDVSEYVKESLHYKMGA